MVDWHRWPGEWPEENGKEYLTYTKDGEIKIHETLTWGRPAFLDFVIAWAELPEAPKWINDQKLKDIRKLKKQISSLNRELRELQKQEDFYD